MTMRATLKPHDIDILELFAQKLEQREIAKMKNIPLQAVKTALNKFGNLYGNDHVYSKVVRWVGDGKTQYRVMTPEGVDILRGWTNGRA